VSHAGLVWLGEIADRSGLTAGFSQVLASAPRRRHDPGVTLVQLAIVSTVTVTFKKQGGATRLSVLRYIALTCEYRNPPELPS
jgi:hypothetical protein